MGVLHTNSLADPQQMLDKTSSFLTSTISALETMEQNGTLSNTGKDYLNSLKEAKNTLENMKNQKKLNFRVCQMPNNGDEKLDASMHYDKKTGEIILSIEDIDTNNIDLVIHELTHAQQLIDGKLWIENGEIQGYDIYDELDAFQQQHVAKYGISAPFYDLKGNYYPEGNHTITIDEIKETYPGVYDHLPTEDIRK